MDGTGGGTVTLGGGIIVSGTTGGVTIPTGVIPGGVTVSTSGGTVTVTQSGSSSTPAVGATVNLGGGITATVTSSGNAALAIPNGLSVEVGPSGGTLTIPGGYGVRVSSTGQIDFILPPGASSIITKAVQLGGMILNAGTGHAVAVRDAIELIVGPLPSNPLLDILDVAVTVGGAVQLGLRQGNDGPTDWIPLYVNRPNLTLEPITIDGGLPPQLVNPSGIEIGTQAKFKIGFAGVRGLFSGVKDDEVTWSIIEPAAGPPISFLNGINKGKTVTIVGNAAGQAKLQVTVANVSPSPTVTTNVFVKNTVKAFVYVVRNDNGSSPATSQSQITTWLNKANAIWKQAGIEFVQEGAINYIDKAIYRVIDDQPELLGLTSENMNTGGVELYFVSDIIYGNRPAGVNAISGDAREGLVINCATAINKTLAHELGHACGLEDVYVEQNSAGNITSLPNDKVKPDWLPLDWNNGPGPAYYPNMRHRDLVSERLLMYGTAESDGFNDNAIAVPRGAVHGIKRSGPSTFYVGLIHVGLVKPDGTSAMNRTPRHW